MYSGLTTTQPFVFPSPRILGCWMMSASTRVFGSSGGRPSGSSPSSHQMETSGCSHITSARRSQCFVLFSVISHYLLYHVMEETHKTLIMNSVYNPYVNDLEVKLCTYIKEFVVLLLPQSGGNPSVRQAQHQLPWGKLSGTFWFDPGPQTDHG